MIALFFETAFLMCRNSFPVSYWAGSVRCT